MSSKFKLYSSEGCHLCEQALAICTGIIKSNELIVVDIVEDESLVELYGIHIPVLENTTNEEKLFWPFDASQIKAIL